MRKGKIQNAKGKSKMERAKVNLKGKIGNGRSR
jgi:hypothetical protein